ncbi:MAG TPA: sodium:proline symporter [Burkholderiales bacterium]
MRSLPQDAVFAVVAAGIAAGISSTLAQMLLWLVFTDNFPEVLFRDARLTAGLLLGTAVLPPPESFDAIVMLVATVVHFSLSICYSAAIGAFTSRLKTTAGVVTGASFGAALYAVNLYGFTELFPWFVQARDWITFVAHLVFGLTVVETNRFLRSRGGAKLLLG